MLALRLRHDRGLRVRYAGERDLDDRRGRQHLRELRIVLQQVDRPGALLGLDDTEPPG